MESLGHIVTGLKGSKFLDYVNENHINPRLSYCCGLISIKEKKKMKMYRRLARKEKRHIMEECYLGYGGKWWLADEVDEFSSDDYEESVKKVCIAAVTACDNFESSSVEFEGFVGKSAV